MGPEREPSHADLDVATATFAVAAPAVSTTELTKI